MAKWRIPNCRPRYNQSTLSGISFSLYKKDLRIRVWSSMPSRKVSMTIWVRGLAWRERALCERALFELDPQQGATTLEIVTHSTSKASTGDEKVLSNRNTRYITDSEWDSRTVSLRVEAFPTGQLWLDMSASFWMQERTLIEIGERYLRLIPIDWRNIVSDIRG